MSNKSTGSVAQRQLLVGILRVCIWSHSGWYSSSKTSKTTAYVTSGSSFTDITGLSITITPGGATTQ